MEYTLDYFIKKFEAIPEEKWTTKSYGSDGVHCALGHCMGNKYTLTNSEIETLVKLTGLCFGYTEFEGGDSTLIANINDGLNSNYKQETPKQRVLAFLNDLKAKQNAIQPAPATQIVDVKSNTPLADISPDDQLTEMKELLSIKEIK